MTDNRTTELLPCPICGGQPDFQHFNITPKVKGRIVCSCGIELRQGENDTDDDMIIIWNTRHVETCEMEYQTDGMMSGWWKCSVCGEAMDTIKACAGREKPKYCGNCGRLVVA